jgi:hypothetical protein
MSRVDSFEMLLRQFDEVRETLGRLEARARKLGVTPAALSRHERRQREEAAARITAPPPPTLEEH